MAADSKKILVAYFSHSGNTREIARQIHAIVGGDIFEIVNTDPYPSNYDAVVERARKELENAHQPKLKVRLEKAASYDIVFIGFPNWWNTFPTPVGAFLRENDFSGKTLMTFCTHEGSGLGRSVSDVAKACPGSKIMPGLAIRGGNVKKAGEAVAKWIVEIGAIPTSVKK
jgi:flavodoxin